MSEADDDKDVLAAEYVLGTLDAEGRTNVRLQMSIDPTLAERVAFWERRLGELHALVDPIEPPATNWEWIKARIATETPQGQVWMPPLAEASAGVSAVDPHAPTPPVSVRQPAQPAPPPPPVVDDEAKPAPAKPGAPPRPAPALASNIAELQRRAGRWRGIALAAGALAATLAGVAVFREVSPRIVEKVVEKEVVRTVEVPGQRVAEFVAVFQNKDDMPAPAFLMTVDIDKKTVSLRRVGAEALAQNSYELWIRMPEQPRPRSLGLVAEDGFTVRRALADYDAASLSRATFGISVEPRGGSPTGQPTGPAIHGKLMQTTPATFPGGMP